MALAGREVPDDDGQHHGLRHRIAGGSASSTFPEEVWVDLKHLKGTMTWIDTQLYEAAVIVNADSSSSEGTRK